MSQWQGQVAYRLAEARWAQGYGQFFLGLDNWSIGQFSRIILDNAGQ